MKLLQIKWYKDVYAYTLANSAINPDEHFKLFTVPGMRHCFVRSLFRLRFMYALKANNHHLK